MRRLTVTITEDDIGHGVPRAVQTCPLALAIKRETNADTVKVDNGEINITRKDGSRETYAYTIRSRRWVRAFDNLTADPKPATFTLSRID